MEECKIEGLLLEARRYLGKKWILKVFSRELGLISLITTRSLSPFLLGEWVVRRGRGEMFSLIDFSLFDPLLGLRLSLKQLEAAGSIASDLLQTQLPEKKGVLLYELTRSYLKQITQSLKPEIYPLSFRLKLLMHEGHLDPERLCEPLTRFALARSFRGIEEAPLSNEEKRKISLLFQELACH